MRTRASLRSLRHLELVAHDQVCGHDEGKHTDRRAAEPALPTGPSSPDTVLRETYALTRRETEILRLLLDHHSNTEISDALYISPRTVSTHLTSINSKMGVSTRHEAARIAAELGLG